MLAERPKPSPTCENPAEAKDIIRVTQERLLGELVKCGENFFQIIRERAAGKDKDFTVDKMVVSPRFHGEEWFVRIESDKTQGAMPYISWEVDTNWRREGRFGKKQIPDWERFRVTIYDWEGVPGRSLNLRAWSEAWEIRAGEKVVLKEPIEFMGKQLTSIHEETFCVAPRGNEQYRWPFSISRGPEDGEVLPKLTVTYGRRSENGRLLKERTVKPWDSRVELKVSTQFQYPELGDQSAEALHQDLFSRFGEASKVLGPLWATFPQEVDFVRFLEEKVGLVIGATNQSLADLQKELQPLPAR